jgi:hypothetical protein
MTTPQDLKNKLARRQTVAITFGRPQMKFADIRGHAQLNFDQLNVIAHHLHAVRIGEDQWQQKEKIKGTGNNDAHA